MEGSQALATRDEGSFLGHGVRATEISLELPPDLSFEQWMEVGHRLRRFTRALPWWVGDYILQGDHAYGEMYAQMMDELGYAYQTLLNYVNTCRSIPVGRRRSELSFRHHEAVKMLEPQPQQEWLQRAVDFGWSSQALREAITEARQTNPGAPQAPPAPTAANGQPPLAAPGELLPQLPAPAEPTLMSLLHELLDAAAPAGMLLPSMVDRTWAVPTDCIERLGRMLGRPIVVEPREPRTEPEVLEGGAPAPAPAPPPAAPQPGQPGGPPLRPGSLVGTRVGESVVLDLPRPDAGLHYEPEPGAPQGDVPIDRETGLPI